MAGVLSLRQAGIPNPNTNVKRKKSASLFQHIPKPVRLPGVFPSLYPLVKKTKNKALFSLLDFLICFKRIFVTLSNSLVPTTCACVTVKALSLVQGVKQETKQQH